VVEGKPHQFVGRLLPVDQSGELMWRGQNGQNKLRLNKAADDAFNGDVLLEGRFFLFTGKGNNGVITESLVKPKPFDIVYPASAPESGGRL